MQAGLLPMEKDPVSQSKWKLDVDVRERPSQLFRLALESELFDLRVQMLRVGDYLINERVVLERKTVSDFALSVVDGRLFAQAAALIRQPQRSLILVEGPRPDAMPRVHPKALKGALLSLAVAWRVPVIFSRNPAESLVCLQLLAEQSQALRARNFERRGCWPRGKKVPRSFVLEGLPGVGPKLAGLLLEHFGSVEKTIQADASQLAAVPGCGARKAAQIRKILTAERDETKRLEPPRTPRAQRL